MQTIDIITIAAGFAGFALSRPVLAALWDHIAARFDAIDAAHAAATGELVESRT